MSKSLKLRPLSSSSFSTRASMNTHESGCFFESDDIALEGMAKLYAAPGITKLYGLIGRGRFATSYHCSDEKHGEVAVKTFDVGVVFRPECEELQELRHPNLVRLYRTLQEGTTCGMVLELCGRSLYDVLHTDFGRRIKVVEDPLHRLRAALDVVRALKYLHKKELCHCDVSSRHVFVDRSLHPESLEIVGVKLGDFQTLCKVNSNSRSMCTMSHIYRPPEETPLQIFPSQVRSSFTGDIYAFGILLHEIMTRSLPYREHALSGDPRLALLVKAGLRPDVTVVPTDPALSSKWGEAMRRQLILCMEKCWLQAESDRPASSEVVSELKDIMKDWVSIRFLLSLGCKSSHKDAKRQLGAKDVAC